MADTNSVSLLIKRLTVATAMVAASLTPFASSAATQSLVERLQLMAQQVNATNYEGVYVHQRDGELKASQVIHSGEADRERLISLTGNAEEIHRNGENVTCYFPKQRSVLMDSSAPRNPFTVVADWDYQHIEQNYHLRQDEALSRVAGRACQRVHLMPRDNYRYGYRLCLDQETNMLLQADLLGQKGNVLEHMMFTQIAYPDTIDAAQFEPAMDFDGVNWMHNPELARGGAGSNEQSNAQDHWQVAALPSGFVMAMEKPHSLRGSRQEIHQMVYTDGLASVSIFIEPIQGQSRLEGHSEMGAINVFGRVLSDHQITVIGDVPKATVRSIALAVETRE